MIAIFMHNKSISRLSLWNQNVALPKKKTTNTCTHVHLICSQNNEMNAKKAHTAKEKKRNEKKNQTKRSEAKWITSDLIPVGLFGFGLNAVW